MKLGVVSDSHGDIDDLIACYLFIEGQKCDYFVHLGDDISDLAFLEKSALNIIAVPGTRDEGYLHDHIRTAAISAYQKQITFTHVKENAPKSSDIIFYGHSHVPSFYPEGARLYINPGHISASKRRFPVSTFCIADFDGKNCNTTFYTTALNSFDKKEFCF
jgi:putative phosphoesterase